MYVELYESWISLHRTLTKCFKLSSASDTSPRSSQVNLIACNTLPSIEVKESSTVLSQLNPWNSASRKYMYAPSSTEIVSGINDNAYSSTNSKLLSLMWNNKCCSNGIDRYRTNLSTTARKVIGASILVAQLMVNFCASMNSNINFMLASASVSGRP